MDCTNQSTVGMESSALMQYCLSATHRTPAGQVYALRIMQLMLSALVCETYKARGLCGPA